MTDDRPDLLALMPFAQTLGIELLGATPDEVRGRLAWRPELCTAGGVLHGGVLMALADSTAGLCAYLNLGDPAFTTTTIESKTNFLRAVVDGHVESISRPLHSGRRIVVIDTDLIDDGGRPVGRVTQSQLVITPS
ncbi:MAG: PaaI family thioesterase [Actinomycetota bacterium]|jgi:uncharacterized protein (TIGR00369 family)|nr:PaaI family thioesterase [Actinomycetota bacterium]